MSKSIGITVNGKSFKLGFGLEVFMKLGELWGLDTLEEVNEQFQVLASLEEGKPTPLKVLKIISEVIAVMISVNSENKETITAAEIRSASMMEFQEMAVELTKGFIASMPHQEIEETEKKAIPKAKKRNP